MFGHNLNYYKQIGNSQLDQWANVDLGIYCKLEGISPSTIVSSFKEKESRYRKIFKYFSHQK